MSIVKLHKAYLVMLKCQKEQILSSLQEKSLVHIVKQKKTNITEIYQPSEISQLREVIGYLKDTKSHRRYFTKVDVDLHIIVKEVLSVKDKITMLKDSVLALQEDIELVSPWGSFETSQDLKSSGYNFYFYKMTGKDLETIDEALNYAVVNQDQEFFYTVVISENQPSKTQVKGQRVKLPEKSLERLRKELCATAHNLEDLIDKRAFYTKYLHCLQQKIIEFEDETKLLEALGSGYDHESFCVVDCYVPQKDSESLEEFCTENSVALSYHQPDENDHVPTLIKTPKFFAAGELLTDFYQTPGYYTVDPSAIIFFSFSLFFAIITADAGYGIILFLGACYYHLYIAREALQKKLANLFLFLSVCTCFYGMLVGSYFGYTPPAESILSKLHVIDLNDFNFMMLFSIGIGIAHIILANIMIIATCNSQLPKVRSFAFVLILLSIVSLFFNAQIIAIFLGSIAALVLLLFSEQASEEGKLAYILARIKGFMHLTNITSLFSDIMSYMRLFALGLAGSALASTFNTLADDVLSAGSLGILGAIVILLLGHTLNFLLALMSGVVHGLRLNYIEFFNWSINSEGFKFKFFNKGSD